MAGDVYACTVERRCSSTGVACIDSDRACKEDARSRGLEVICESQPQVAADAAAVQTTFVYCPPTTGRGGDSFALWILLAVAGAIAIVGSTVSWVALRRRK
jgi:hypothetical protein